MNHGWKEDWSWGKKDKGWCVGEGDEGTVGGMGRVEGEKKNSKEQHPCSRPAPLPGGGPERGSLQ